MTTPTSDKDDARMPHQQRTPDPGPWQPDDLEAIREKYRIERERRLRPDGVAQYQKPVGDLAEYADDPWSEPLAEREPVTDEVDAVILGSGFGGLTSAANLRKAGLGRIRLVDAAGGVGGTWYWNRYPGVACDIDASIYLPLLEEIGGMPSRKYAPGHEIRRHAERIAEHFDLYQDALFQTQVTSLHWDDELSRWRVGTDRGDAFTARYAVVSSGPFNNPKLPGIPGLEEFGGHAFHTSRWDYEFTGGDEKTREYPGLAGKRVALIGTGATAVQIVPTIATSCAELLVVQRTPSAVDIRGDRETDGEWWARMTAQPGWQRARQDNFLALVSGAHADEDLIGDQWTDSATARGRQRLMSGTGEDVATAMELADHQKMSEIRARVADIVADPDTAAALQPWYRQMCKRPCFSDVYLQAFNRDNVRLVDTKGRGVDRITETALVVDGVEHPVDVIVFATGFEVEADPIVRAGADILGRKGLPLAEYWADGLRTLHGWVSREFPNLFQLGSTQNAVSFNFAHNLQEQSENLAAVVAEAERRGVLVEPTAKAEQAWIDTIHARRIDMSAFQAECTPGYYNLEGQPPKSTNHFGGGAMEFAELVRAWRSNGGMDDVLAE
ncbi:cation diffusion facilitator CzcD-associated flavoprotein CzcO [Prauserella sediminis]|uniref:Cation diffusion facilitator CzcD-associated flavoprotein CzcO n=1 Tax=Prauserella sediminis TaxID=577680 RepID=A0A839XWX4_9PSEU|nr:NAD(P)/FAD-dependent oxidoreductase [Prauserella sediminis]MBB3665578.1 cation diffusion facilitator CzcD-associated flavoprotein CzcO [Prauserella sediminis]